LSRNARARTIGVISVGRRESDAFLDHEVVSAASALAEEERFEPLGKKQVLRGDVPSPVAPPPGCAFHTRCPYAEARCRAEVPELREVRPGHWVSCHLRP